MDDARRSQLLNNYELEQKAKTLFAEHAYAEAVPLFEHLAMTDPQVRYYEKCAECFGELGDLGKCILHAYAAAGYGSNQFKAHAILAGAFLKLGEIQKAYDHIHASLMMNPQYKEAHRIHEAIQKANESEKPFPNPGDSE